MPAGKLLLKGQGRDSRFTLHGVGVWGLGYRVHRVYRAWVSVFRVHKIWGSGFTVHRVWGLRLRVQDLGFRSIVKSGMVATTQEVLCGSFLLWVFGMG